MSNICVLTASGVVRILTIAPTLIDFVKCASAIDCGIWLNQNEQGDYDG